MRDSAPNVIEKAISLLHGKPTKILDLGCGCGELGKQLKENKRTRKSRIYGVDIDKKRLEEARRTKAYSSLIQADIDKRLPLGSSSFDAIFSIDVIEHLKNPRRLVSESYRLLKPRGQLILSTPNVTNYYSRLRMLKSGWLFMFPLSDPQPHRSPIFYWQLKQMLEEEGLELKKMDYNRTLPFYATTLTAFLASLSYQLILFFSPEKHRSVPLHAEILIFKAVKPKGGELRERHNSRD